MTFLSDPCPLPDAQKKRALNEKERLLYAPMAGVGGLVYDKDAVYIDLPVGLPSQQVSLTPCLVPVSNSDLIAGPTCTAGGRASHHGARPVSHRDARHAGRQDGRQQGVSVQRLGHPGPRRHGGEQVRHVAAVSPSSSCELILTPTFVSQGGGGASRDAGLGRQHPEGEEEGGLPWARGRGRQQRVQ